MKRYFHIFLIAGASFISVTAAAQFAGSLSGKITGQEDQPIPGASVRILNTSLGATTDASGDFVIQNLAAGSYRVEISAIGYATREQAVVVAGTSPLNFRLQENLTQLDDVIVTAEKKEERLQNIPVSISSISARQIQEYRIWNSKDITALVPNLYSSNPGDGRNVTSIRGITSTSYDPAVATYIDGVNQFGLDTYIAQLFDVERIEVLRGPQGTLYGRNAMGGVINIITKQPTNKTDGFAELNFGNFGQQRYTAAVRTPLVKDKLFLGMSAVYDHNDGFYTNQFDGSKFDKRHSFTGNYYLKYFAGRQWTITANLKHNQNRNNGAFPLAYQSDALANPFNLNQDAKAQMVDNVFNSSLSVAHTGERVNFTSQTAYQSNYRYYKSPIDGDFSPIDGVTIINNFGSKWNNVKVITQEFKLTSPSSSDSPFKWTAGTYLFYQDNPVKQTTRFGRDAFYVTNQHDSLYSLISTSKGKNFGGALFGQATYSISDKLDVTAGIRYDYEHKKLDVLGEYQHDPDPNPAFQTRPDTSASASFHAFSPKLSLAYHVSESSNLFATWSRGFRTGGLTPLSSDTGQPPLRPFKPEYSDNFELGIKNTFFNNRLRANITFFYINLTDAQVPLLILPDAITITSNAGKLNSKGVELELSTAITKGLQLEYNLGINDARYKTFSLGNGQQQPSLYGRKQIFTAPITSMLALQYSYVLQKSTALRFVLRGEWMYLGRKYFNFDASNPLTQGAYGLLNVRAGVAARGYELMFWGRNLGDKVYIDYAYDFGAAHLGNPRNYGVTIRKNF